MLRQAQTSLRLETRGQGLYEFTGAVQDWISGTGIARGQLTVFCRHTSCSLTIQENADPDVQLDLAEFFRRLVPEDMPWLRHVMEGPDDMPAHIKSALSDVSLTIPVDGGQALFGTWQGIYLFEHRASLHQRTLVLHLMGE